jgi:beta-lactamase regulating signal transducer with metallopeptidase domain
MAGLANHLWQSTLFGLAAAALVATMRGNRAAVRHWIWVIASVKWLVPFAWLIAAGSALSSMLPATGVGAPALQAQPALSISVLQFTEPFTTVNSFAPTPFAVSSGWLTTVLIVLWAGGVLLIAATRLRDWLRIRSTILDSEPLNIGVQATRLDVRAAPGLLEPGVVGIWRPVLLLPAGIEDQLMPAHLESVVAHELCHVRRRDNMTAAIHMVVESVFWFHPLVWWIGARMIEERERACDEEVLRGGALPRDYAEGIVRVCKLYIESPLACVAGVTGSNLKRRIEDIMMNRIGQTLSVGRKLLLTAAAAFVLATPIVVGAMALSVRTESTPPATVAASKQSPAVGDLAAVLKVMRDPAATAADKERLIGRSYSGVVVVDTVRLNPKGAVVIAVTIETAAGDDKAPRIAFQFNATTVSEKLNQLRKRENARLRGTLIKFWVEGKVTWLEFSDVVIEGKRP